MKWLGYLLVLFGFHLKVSGKYTEGHLYTIQNWAFLERFCFLSEDGQFEYNIEYPADIGPVNLLLYYDSEEQWPSVYKTNKTCQQKESILSLNNSQIVNLTTNYIVSGCSKLTAEEISHGAVKGGSVIKCHRSRRFRSARERWWFIAASNCNSTKGLNIKYKFLMTNGPPGDYWHEHLSADEFYILPVLVSYSLAYFFMIIAVVVCSIELKSRQFLHATYKMFMGSVILQEVGILAQGLAYVRYSIDGKGLPRLKRFGRVTESISEIIFLLLLLLLAKGYTVTRGRLRLGSSIKLTIFMCLYVLLTMALYGYENEYFDPGEVLYLYESPAGYGVITLRIVAWWMFIYSTVFTLRHYPEKATFYYLFNLFGTLWFVSGPGFILAANNLIDKWVRESVVCGAMHFIAFSGHVFFLLLTIPSKANKNFPYHVRTNQIGIMEMTGVSGNSSIYNFGHHPYEPGGPRTVPIDLFTVSKTLALNTKVMDYETNPYPHAINGGYTQTILLPFSIREGSDSGSSSLEQSPKHILSKVDHPLPPNAAQSAKISRPPRENDDRQVVSAGGDRVFHSPTAPNLNQDQNTSRPGTASTVSANTAERSRNEALERAQEEILAVQKLTNMFMAQSLRHPD